MHAMHLDFKRGPDAPSELFHKTHADGCVLLALGLKVPRGHSTGSGMPPCSGAAVRSPSGVSPHPSAQKAPAGHAAHAAAPNAELKLPGAHGAHAAWGRGKGDGTVIGRRSEKMCGER